MRERKGRCSQGHSPVSGQGTWTCSYVYEDVIAGVGTGKKADEKGGKRSILCSSSLSFTVEGFSDAMATGTGVLKRNLVPETPILCLESTAAVWQISNSNFSICRLYKQQQGLPGREMTPVRIPLRSFCCPHGCPEWQKCCLWGQEREVLTQEIVPRDAKQLFHCHSYSAMQPGLTPQNFGFSLYNWGKTAPCALTVLMLSSEQTGKTKAILQAVHLPS